MPLEWVQTAIRYAAAAQLGKQETEWSPKIIKMSESEIEPCQYSRG